MIGSGYGVNNAYHTMLPCRHAAMLSCGHAAMLSCGHVATWKVLT